jgi:hypothetical protein
MTIFASILISYGFAFSWRTGRYPDNHRRILPTANPDTDPRSYTIWNEPWAYQGGVSNAGATLQSAVRAQAEGF